MIKNLPPAAVRSGGFTLIELLVTVAIAVILITIAVPGFNSIIRNVRLTGLANTLVADLQLARSEAIKRNSTVRLCQSSDGATCANNANWGLGWLMSHTVGATTTTLNVQQPVLTGYLVTGPILPVDFRSTGGVGTPITFRICPSVATADGQGREITLSITGRPTVSATRTGLCS